MHFFEFNDTECKPLSPGPQQGQEQAPQQLPQQATECMNKNLFKDNAKHFVDCERHSRDVTTCARCPLARCHIHAAAFFQRICSAKCLLWHSRNSIHAAAFTQYFCSQIHAAPQPMQQHSRNCTYAAALTLQHCFSALTQQV